MTAEQYVAARVEQKEDIVMLLPVQYPDGSGKLLMMKEFPFGIEAGIIIITMGDMNGQPVINSAFQTVNTGAVFTLSCFTTPENQGYYFPIFSQIVDSFRFGGG